MKILSVGPFLGDFENEILQFRPYAKWLSKVVQYDNIYLSTHENRFFLYDFIPEENMIPVYGQFSRDEENQRVCVHDKLSKRDFNLILKKFKEDILKKEKCNRKELENYYLPYSKISYQSGVHKKIFEEIKINREDVREDNKNKIVFIPSKKEKRNKVAEVYKWLMSCYNDVVVIGDTNTWFRNNNEVLNKIDYFENGLKTVIDYISTAKAVITPLSYWTLICNLQKKNVFSWGKNVGQYREEGIYNFGNRNCNVIPTDRHTDLKIIISGINNFIKGI